MPHPLKTVSWFIAVGCVAAATHWLVAVLCVEHFEMSPLISNFVAWLVALTVSFSGHYRLTFSHQVGAAWPAARRFFVVSISGFSINQSAYAYLLKNTDLSYKVLLFIVLLTVAVLTYVVSRSWAFYSKPE
jgi:putative flippase GtrA